MARREKLAAEELEQLLSSGVPADQAGAHAALVGLATAVRDTTTVPTPDPAFRASLRETLMNAPPPAPIQPTGWEQLAQRATEVATRVTQSSNAIIATATTAGLIGATGLVIAGQDALPGDRLRPVRTMTESVRLALAGDLLDQGLLELQFASGHLDDLVAQLDELTSEQVLALLDRIDDLALRGTADVLLGAIEADRVALLAEAERFVSVATAQLDALLPRLQGEAASLASSTLDALDEMAGRIDRAVPTEVVVDGGDPDPTDGGPVPTQPPTDVDSPSPTDQPTGTPADATELPTDATDLPTELPTGVTDLPTELPTGVTDLPTGVTDVPTVLSPDATELPGELLDDASDTVDTTTVEPTTSDGLGDVIDDVVDDVLGG